MQPRHMCALNTPQQVWIVSQQCNSLESLAIWTQFGSFGKLVDEIFCILHSEYVVM